MNLQMPSLSLVLLVGASGSGKSTFAAKHFLPSEVVSSDHYRAVVSDDENDQSASNDAFELVHAVVAKRLARGKLTVVDATNLLPELRATLLALARQHHAAAVAVVFDLPMRICLERNQKRPNRQLVPQIVRGHITQLARTLGHLDTEGFKRIYRFTTAAEIDAAVVTRIPSRSQQMHETGPFDIIGDIHGCFDELCELLEKLGYRLNEDLTQVTPPAHATEKRRVIFLGDLVDRGPHSPLVLRLVMNMVKAGHALFVPGNHDVKLARKLRTGQGNTLHGLQSTLEQLEQAHAQAHAGPAGIPSNDEISAFIESFTAHLVLDGGQLVVAHAGMRAEMQGRSSGAVRSFALYGDTTGEVDDFGLPVRLNWAKDYRGSARVVYGHTPVHRAEWLHRTICIDTGCVFGGALTALRYPELTLTSVPARRVYWQPTRPLDWDEDEDDGTLEMLCARAAKYQMYQTHDANHEERIWNQQAWETFSASFIAKTLTTRRTLEVKVGKPVVVNHENTIAALRDFLQIPIHPAWLIHLPATETMDTCKGIRCTAVLCRDATVVESCFGIARGVTQNPAYGVVYTRAGVSLCAPATVAALVKSAEQAGIFQKMHSDWLCFAMVYDEGQLKPIQLLAGAVGLYLDQEDEWHQEICAAWIKNDDKQILSPYIPEVSLTESEPARRIKAVREETLAREALRRFVEREPLYRIHACLCALLAVGKETYPKKKHKQKSPQHDNNADSNTQEKTDETEK